MAVYQVFTVAVIVVLAVAATAAIYLGLLNWFGAAYVVRCAACHHLTLSSAKDPQASCPHFFNDTATTEIYTAGHRDQPVRVVGDRLRY